MIKYEAMTWEQFYSAFNSIEKMPKNEFAMLESLYQFYCAGYRAGNNNKVRDIIDKLELKIT